MYRFSVTTSHTRGRPSSSPAPRDLPSLAYTFSGAYTLETHSHLQPTRSYIDVLVGTTPTTQYRTEHPQGSSSCLPATTGSFPSSVTVLVAPFELQPAPSMLQHKPSYTKTYPKTYSDPGLTLRAEVEWASSEAINNTAVTPLVPGDQEYRREELSSSQVGAVVLPTTRSEPKNGEVLRLSRTCFKALSLKT
ncbi:hypothetical protein C8J55DRAFT_558326 [Lentinula edodes]|uniref:Uncharacterized protein n=1 Tax=Lentinula lateritia TaxID=40482 RepID=A0A9W9AS48_9AGAR|nr:hypothetical protein C8J55DRAFT_558326 [Lentinula edodes]